MLVKAQAGLAKNTVRLIRAGLSAMLSAAIDAGIINTNPVLQRLPLHPHGNDRGD